MCYNWGAITALDTHERYRFLVDLPSAAIDSMPIVHVNRQRARQLRQESLFVHIGHYGHHVQLHSGEIGHFDNVRYVNFPET